MERDSPACRYTVLQCLKADQMETLCSTADKMNKRLGLVWSRQSSTEIK